MLNNRKSNQECNLYAVCNGECIPLSEVPDEVFSSGMLGQGVAFSPADGDFVSPVEGEVVSVAETAHAYSLCTSNGVDVLVHIGVDTVGLGGRGITALVKEGERVAVGTPLARVQLELLQEKGISPITSVIITSEQELCTPDLFYGRVRAGENVVLRMDLSKEGKG